MQSFETLKNQIIARLFALNAVSLRFDNPVTWASGYPMPIYNDNRTLLKKFADRKLVTEAFVMLLRRISHEDNIHSDVVAGTSTSGIAPAVRVADLLEADYCYVRSSPKGHGLKNSIEGLAPGENLAGKHVVLFEDVVSTGGSSVDAVNALYEAQAESVTCLTIYNYEFDKAKELFAAVERGCKLYHLFSFMDLVEFAKKQTPNPLWDEASVNRILDWYQDPWNWGDKNGFPSKKSE